MKKATRQIQKEQTKELLIRTAYRLFSERGILKTRMSDIAEAAGVSHGTVFLHFQTQEKLITEVIETYCGKIALRTHELANPSTSIRELLAAHLAGIREYEPFYTRLVIENRFLPISARDAWINMQSAISFHFSRVIEKESNAGTILQIPIHLLFNTWLGLIHYYLLNGDLLTPDGKEVIKIHGDTLISTYMKMVQCKNDRPK